MTLAFVCAENTGETDPLLTRLAHALLAEGAPLAAAVQETLPGQDDQPGDMLLTVLPQGPTLRISQDLGADSEGCRLDPQMLETAVAETARRLPGARLLIINKFGRHEAEGRGFRPLIGEAMAQGIPVLTGVNRHVMAEFLDFADGLGTSVPPSAGPLLDWARQVLADRD